MQCYAHEQIARKICPVVQANTFFPWHSGGYFPYFEITITSANNPDRCKLMVGLMEKELTINSGPEMLSCMKYGYTYSFMPIHNIRIKSRKPFKVGDVIGCGVDRDYRIFFTENGNFVGVVTTLNVWQKLYPVVQFGEEDTVVTGNFGNTPFLFHYEEYFPRHKAEIPQDFGPTLDYVMDLNMAKMIASHLKMEPVCQLSMVNKIFREATYSNEIWWPLVEVRWPNTVQLPKLKSWRRFYIRRHNIQNGSSSYHAVDNCFEWEFRCPMELSKLQQTRDSNIDFCPSCQKNVYIVHDKQELTQKVSQGMCVVIDFDWEINKSRTSRMMMGGIRRRR